MFLHTTINEGQQHVYTVLQVTPNGTSVSATVAGSITLDKGATIDFKDLVVSSAFDATPGGGGGGDKKGTDRTDTPSKDADGNLIPNPDDVSDQAVTVDIKAANLGTGDTLTITGFGTDDKLAFDFNLNKDSLKVNAASGSSITLGVVNDGEGDAFNIVLDNILDANGNLYVLTPDDLAGLMGDNAPNYLNTLFGEGTLDGFTAA